MNNDEKRLRFNTFARNYDIALASGNKTNMEASIKSLISELPGSDIPQLNMDNLKNFSDKIDEIISSARSNGLDVHGLEVVRDFLRTAYHLRREAYDAIDSKVAKNKNDDKRLFSKVRKKVEEVKLALYLSGDETLGRTITTVPESGMPVVQVRLTEKDVEKFGKNTVYAAQREESIRNRRSKMAVPYSSEAVAGVEAIIADLTDVGKLRVERKTLEEQRKQVEDGLTPLEDYDYKKINPKEATPTREATETAEYGSFEKIMNDNIAELERITKNFNTYEDLMRLNTPELEKLLITMDAFNEGFDKDARKIAAFINKHPADIRALNLSTQFTNLKKAVYLTRMAIDDVQEVKENTLGIARDREDYARMARDMYFENMLHPEAAKLIRTRYILGLATDKELEDYNYSAKDAFKVHLTAQEKKDKAAIAAGNEVLEGSYQRDFTRYSKTVKRYEKRGRELTAHIKQAQELTTAVKSGKITNYMNYLIHEKGSIPIGFNLYSNIDDKKAVLYEKMLGYLAVPEQIDEAILHDIVTEGKKTPGKDEDKDKGKKPEGPGKDKEPDGPGGGSGDGTDPHDPDDPDKDKKPDGPDGPPGGGSGGAAGDGSGDGTDPEDPDKDKKPDGPDGPGGGSGDGTGDGSGTGTDPEDPDKDKDKDKEKKHRIKPEIIGKIHKVSTVIAKATGLIFTGLVLTYVFVNGVAIAIPASLGLTAAHLVSGGVSLATKKK